MKETFSSNEPMQETLPDCGVQFVYCDMWKDKVHMYVQIQLN